ncbi:C45 family autoproteolytic acyltransferase/hydolase [Vreelandella alkaliphila]|uniref:6-aminopenicillanic acid acyl-transferase n=1 Tax=Vreelandella alkaliphila TaxID=272774 RepID=A0ABX4HLZ7_9GAMM|nr:C45 family peptidase [Halomonas humidisoli]PAU73539.1 6-aminopenicillanic acid acyl-transferase [Halomonas humidisoli]
MSKQTSSIGWQIINGQPRDIGVALGRAGRDAVHRFLLPSAIWAEINDPIHRNAVATMAANTQRDFPQVWEELEGLAEGLNLPIEAVFAWNCRGDLLAHAPDGCTTLVLPGETPLVAHNEDGLPFFRGHCFMAEVTSAMGEGFTAFCYPGSIPGHTLAFTRQGWVQAVNNLRLLNVTPRVPRMVLGRAALSQPNMAGVVALLQRYNECGGFHFSLAECGQREVMSIEFGGGETAQLALNAPSVHANHALYHPSGLASQWMTDSSRDRQQRGDQLLAEGETAPLAILHDQQASGLPILRLSADDPDHENTLVTAVMRLEVDGVAWQLYDRPGAPPAYDGKLFFAS